MTAADRQDRREKLDAIRGHYEPRFDRPRENYDVLDWASAASQHERFEVLLREVPLAGLSLLDIGCGLGDLKALLDERGLEVDYTGTDVLECMVDACRKRFPDGRFIHANVFAGDDVPPGAFDVVFVSGVFNLDLGNNMAFLPTALRRMLEMARQYAVFNLLHRRMTTPDTRYFTYEPADVLAILADMPCRARLVDDYLPNDFTIVCRNLTPREVT